MNNSEASIALRRFGLGPRRGDLARIAGDPRGYVLAAIDRKDAGVLRVAASSTERSMSAPAQSPVAGAKPAAQPDADKRAKPGEVRREVFRGEALARLERAATTDQPFVERLVYFWSNHFCISASKDQVVRTLAGAFEREPIRPHVLGRFADMLKAVEQHPAMLFYLDNVLHQARDLKPTRDLRAVLKGVLRDHLPIADRALAEIVFPASSSTPAVDGLVG